MDAPWSSGVVPATFQTPHNKNAISPKEFLEFLHSIQASLHQDGVATRNKDGWVIMISGLSDFWGSFPFLTSASRGTSNERITLTHYGLGILQYLSGEFERVFSGEDELLRKLSVSLLGLCVATEAWLEVEENGPEDSKNPSTLYKKASSILVNLLREWLEYFPQNTEYAAVPSVALGFLSETLDVTHEGEQHPLNLCFFSRPRLARGTPCKEDIPIPPGSSNMIRLPSASYIPVFCSIVVDLFSQTLPLAKSSYFMTVDLTRRVVQLTREIFDLCLSAPMNASARTRCLIRVVESSRSLHSRFDLEAVAIEDLPARLLARQLVKEANAQSNPSLRYLASLFSDEAEPFVLTPTHASAILEVISKDDVSVNTELKALSAPYLRKCADRMTSHVMLGAQRTTLAGILHQHGLSVERDVNDSHQSQPNQVVGNAESHSSEWRSLASQELRTMIDDGNGVWMDVDDGLSDTLYASRGFEIISQMLNRPLEQVPLATRIAVVNFITLVFTKTARVPTEEGTSVEVCVLLAKVLIGPSSEVNSLLRRKSYKILSKVIKYGIKEFAVNDYNMVTEGLQRGLLDRDRTTRLSAGNAVAELIKVYMNIPEEQAKVHSLFFHFNRILESNIWDGVKETMLITIGLIGKHASGDILREVVFSLILQLGEPNPSIKAVAYTQLSKLARHHKKPPYALVLPFFPRVAPHIVLRKCTRPTLLAETCQFLSVRPRDFLSVTLPWTLPFVFANCDNRVLEEISTELEKTPASFFISHSHDILSFVFRLQGPGETRKALIFIVNVVAPESTMVDIKSIVGSCLVALLAELVVVLGDENEEHAASDALRKVARVLSTEGKSDSDPAPLLKKHMLGIVCYINDKLQDVRGKQPMMSKTRIIRGMAAFIRRIGDGVHSVAPQIMATLQTMFTIPELSEVALSTWYTFLTTIAPQDLGPHVGATSASLVSSWERLSSTSRELAKRCLDYIVFEAEHISEDYLDEIADLSGLPELHDTDLEIKRRRANRNPRQQLLIILERSSSDNHAVALRSLAELRTFMFSTYPDFIRGLASGDAFDPLVGTIQSALLHIASRDGDSNEDLRLLAYECIGILGAVDPDRCEIDQHDSRMVVRSNFTDEAESVLFAMHLIKDVLVGAFRSTSDIKYQANLAYTIQELLRFCNFTPALVTSRNTTSVPVKVRNRWNNLPKHVLETITPLLEGRFTAPSKMPVITQHPIYPEQNTYREWIQLWTTHLITRASGDTARRIFGVFRTAIRYKDVEVAHHLLPHVVLNILLSGDGKDAQDIRAELLVVLEDQVNSGSSSSADKKLLSAQVVFMLLDHLSKYVRILRQDISSRKAESSKRSRTHHALAESEEQLVRVDSLLSSINHDLMAKAALQCKAYARSLMNFEKQIITLQERDRPASQRDLTPFYERLHEIYAYLDEPDGMEGISTLILSPSLEHQIRQHESTGRWTAAQSCWEVRLQQSPDNLDFHLGLLRCLRNLGHYDTLRTHVRGVLVRNPSWESALASFQAESAWMIGAWDDLQRITETNELNSPSVMKARVLLAMHSGEHSQIATALSRARSVLGSPISASGTKGYRRSYDAVLDLHAIHELEMIYRTVSGNSTEAKALRMALSARLDLTLPNFRVRESVLSMRRVAFCLRAGSNASISKEIGRTWLTSAKIARTAKQWQTAYSATLQAQQGGAPFYFMESAKLLKATGEPLRALQELENSMRLSGMGVGQQDTIDLTEEDNEEFKCLRAKAHILLARWMNESGRYDSGHLLKAFSTAANQGAMLESAYFHLGHFHDQWFKQLPSSDDERGVRMNLHTVREYSKAMMHGSKYVYQAIPRILTLWLDGGENSKITAHAFYAKINGCVATAIDSIPVYKWFAAFPQIVSRVGHSNPRVYVILSKLICKVIREYPHQALWLFASVVKSTKANREARGRTILDALKNDPANAETQLPKLITLIHVMTDELLRLCNYPIDDDRKTLSMRRDFPKLAALGRSPLLIPLQESLTVNLPPTSSTENSVHVPFPTSAPTFEEFSDEIEVMRSLARPRKITIRGSNGQTYMFLGKPKDDLRKDARLMDFNAIINKLLKANSESRKRQLHIRTYGVVTLNEECGFIQWVPNTIPIRPVLLKYYEAKRIRSWSSELGDTFRKIKDAQDKEAAELFVTKVLPSFPPVFHEWFVETFPEPTAWLASRLSYGRTAAVMSMVGFILGLGDRHCENILLDTNTGDLVHVDFNCLFEKGKTLETPERVPFRLTQNMIDGLGVTGAEGVFRIACEITMQLLKNNRDSLMSVLDAFIHDPLVEWEDEKRKMDRDRRNAVRSSTDLRHLAKNALRPIERKLKGVYSPWNVKSRAFGGTGDEKEISTGNLVQMLIQEAVDDANLAKMYPGWAAWH